MTARRIAALLGAVALIYWASGKFFPKQDDRTYLLGLPSHIATLAEQGKTGEIRKHLSESYSDSNGRNYSDINRLLTAQALAGGGVTVFTLGPKVEIDASGTRATLVFRAAMARGPRNPGILSLPDSASFWDFNVDLDKSSGSWLVISGSWTQGS